MLWRPDVKLVEVGFHKRHVEEVVNIEELMYTCIKLKTFPSTPGNCCHIR
jgi:hypothetical protein